MVLGRLAIDRRCQGLKLGGALLREAMLRTLRVSEQAGVRALVVHAIDDEAVAFYTRYGFQIFPPETRTLLLSVETVAASSLDTLFGSMRHKGPALSIEDMNAAIAQEAGRRARD
jgi:hypothetical protein